MQPPIGKKRNKRKVNKTIRFQMNHEHIRREETSALDMSVYDLTRAPLRK